MIAKYFGGGGKISRQQKALVVGLFVAGMLSHGFIFFNNISYHDGIVAVYGIGNTIELGRWSLWLMEKLMQMTVDGIYAVPLFNGVMTMAFIALAGMLIVHIVRIENTLSAVYVGTIMIVFPVVTSTFAYMFTAPAYGLALFLNVLVVYILTEKQNIFRLCLCVGILGFALGIYQAYFAVSVTLFIISLIVDILDNIFLKSKDVVLKGIWYLGTLFGGIVFYLLTTKLVLRVVDLDLIEYQGMKELGKLDFKVLVSRIRQAYRNLSINPNWNGINNSPFLKYLVWGICIITACLIIAIIARSIICGLNKILFIVLLGILPVGVNLIYMMSTSDGYVVHTLMRYPLIFVYILPVVLMERMHLLNIKKKENKNIGDGKCVLWGMLWIVSCCYIYLNNVAYLKVSFLHAETVAYYTVLIAEIKGVEGYRDEMPVVYVGENLIEDKTNYQWSPLFNQIVIDGYNQDLRAFINDYGWRRFMERYCGYLPYEMRADINELPEIEMMPCYPDYGSIKVVNDKVIVKFSE